MNYLNFKRGVIVILIFCNFILFGQSTMLTDSLRISLDTAPDYDKINLFRYTTNNEALTRSEVPQWFIDEVSYGLSSGKSELVLEAIRLVGEYKLSSKIDEITNIYLKTPMYYSEAVPRIRKTILVSLNSFECDEAIAQIKQIFEEQVVIYLDGSLNHLLNIIIKNGDLTYVTKLEEILNTVETLLVGIDRENDPGNEYEAYQTLQTLITTTIDNVKDKESGCYE